MCPRVGTTRSQIAQSSILVGKTGLLIVVAVCFFPSSFHSSLPFLNKLSDINQVKFLSFSSFFFLWNSVVLVSFILERISSPIVKRIRRSNNTRTEAKGGGRKVILNPSLFGFFLQSVKCRHGTREFQQPIRLFV